MRRTAQGTAGFKDSDPGLDADINQHTGILRFGNDVYDRWSGYPVLGNVEIDGGNGAPTPSDGSATPVATLQVLRVPVPKSWYGESWGCFFIVKEW
jgi:hypothetical protein